MSLPQALSLPCFIRSTPISPPTPSLSLSMKLLHMAHELLYKSSQSALSSMLSYKF